MTAKIFPCVLIFLSGCAAVVCGCGCGGDWRRCLYWAAAAVLNAAVTF